jgi:hypothetical protein
VPLHIRKKVAQRMIGIGEPSDIVMLDTWKQARRPHARVRLCSR